MKKSISILLAIIIVLGVGSLAACSKTSDTSTTTANSSTLSGNITADGSTALQPLLTKAIAPFKEKYSFGGSITINGGGSGAGLTDVMSGAVNIGNSDVTPVMAGKPGDGLVDHQVCVVGVGIAVSNNVYANIKSISSADLTAIFNGSITDWKNVKGYTGASLPIQVFFRKSGSGTRKLFEQYGSQASLTDTQLAKFANFSKKESSGDLETAITSAPTTVGAIGYDSIPYCKNLKLLALNDVPCDYAHIYTGEYNIWGYEHMYTKGTPSKTIQTFIDYISSADFSSTIISSGYGVISEMKTTRK